MEGLGFASIIPKAIPFTTNFLLFLFFPVFPWIVKDPVNFFGEGPRYCKNSHHWVVSLVRALIILPGAFWPFERPCNPMTNKPKKGIMQKVYLAKLQGNK